MEKNPIASITKLLEDAVGKPGNRSEEAKQAIKVACTIIRGERPWSKTAECMLMMTLRDSDPFWVHWNLRKHRTGRAKTEFTFDPEYILGLG